MLFVVVFIVEQAVAVALKIGVFNLLAKFAADTFVLLDQLPAAGTIASGSFEACADARHDFLVFIKFNRHYISIPFLRIIV